MQKNILGRGLRRSVIAAVALLSCVQSAPPPSERLYPFPSAATRRSGAAVLVTPRGRPCTQSGAGA